MNETPVAPPSFSAVKIRKAICWRGIRVLAWDRGLLYACRGYQVVRLQIPPSDLPKTSEAAWESIARFRPVWWRNLTSRTSLTYRLVRDGFHALAVLPGDSGDSAMIAAVPGAIVTRATGSDEFRVTHPIRRGTRPLHITAVPGKRIYWGEYFDNRERAEVHIYYSQDQGQSWQVAYTFPAGAVRHVHNIVYDRWANCLWILTGDEGSECKILRAACDFSSVDEVLAGNQQARAVAAIPMPDALYLSTDTPSEANHVLRLDRRGNMASIADLASSSIYGGRVGEAILFSTMVEPSAVNRGREVQLVGSGNGGDWQVLARWQKDRWPLRYFQYGNAILPDGENTTNYLAATTIAVEHDDLVSTLWEVESPATTRVPRPA